MGQFANAGARQPRAAHFLSLRAPFLSILYLAVLCSTWFYSWCSLVDFLQLHRLVLHVSSYCSICAFCCSLHHGFIKRSLPCCLTCMLSHKNCSLRSPLCPLLHMYHRLFVLCRFLLGLWSSRVMNKTCSQRVPPTGNEHGSGLDRTRSGVKPILAGWGVDRTEEIFVVLMWLFWTYQKF